MTTTKTKGTYATQITQQSDGYNRVFFLYNVKNPTRDHTSGDIWDMKVYKSIKMAEKKADAWLAEQ